MVLKYYYDLMSQPSRALYILLKSAGVPFEQCPVALRNGEHFTAEFAAVNAFKKVPAIVDGDFHLSESIAIMRYVVAKYGNGIADHWYPSDVRSRARVDQYCSWQHLNLRLYGSMLFQARVLRGKTTPSERYLSGMERCVGELEQLFLPDAGPGYIGGLADVSFADALCCCELEQPITAGIAVLDGHPKAAAYVERVRRRLNPVYDEAHQFSRVLRQKIAEGKL